MTEWRACAEWPDFIVSDDGQFMRISGPKWAKIGKPRKLPVALNGYVTFRLSARGRVASVYLHTLICAAFHGPRPSKRHQVAHWDGNKTNNRASNLRWALPTENVADTRRHGTISRGERNGHAILTAKQVREIRRRHQKGPRSPGNRPSRLKMLAEEFGVSLGCIKEITQGINWRHLKQEEQK